MTLDTSFGHILDLHDLSLENTYIFCLLMWPAQHRNGNSNPVRFGMNTAA